MACCVGSLLSGENRLTISESPLHGLGVKHSASQRKTSVKKYQSKAFSGVPQQGTSYKKSFEPCTRRFK